MINRETHKIDANKIPLGRVATKVAAILMGKTKPSYKPYKDEGDFVVVENFDKIVFTGNKLKQKMYYKPTNRPGKLKSESLGHLLKRRNIEVLRRAVWGMLPKNTLRKSMIKRLTVLR